MKKILFASSLIAILSSSAASAGDQIRIVGSSTVYPLVTVVAENFGKGGKFKTPIVESTGTGGGFKLFCAGIGGNTPDIANASRKVKASEVEECKKSGVTDIAEIKIGYDGIVIANAINSPKYNLSKEQIFKALGRQVPQNGKLIDNPYQLWSDIDLKLPKEKIEVYGPPPTSGTRDSFAEQVLEEVCVKMPEFQSAYPDDKERKKSCMVIREDGKYIEAGENDNIIMQKLVSNPVALGIFGYDTLLENGSKIKASTVNGVEPNFENISGSKYPVSRALYVYVKLQNAKTTAGIKEFLTELVSDKAIGTEGYLVEKGLIPLKKDELSKIKKSALTLEKTAL